MIEPLLAVVATYAAGMIPASKLPHMRPRRDADVIDAVRRLGAVLASEGEEPLSSVRALVHDAAAYLARFDPSKFVSTRSSADAAWRSETDLWTGLASFLQELYEIAVERRAEAECVLESIPWRPGDRILDFGGGLGFITASIAAGGGTVVYVDKNPIKRAFVGERACRRGYQLTTLRRLPRAGGFDVVLALDVLDHLGRPAHAIRRLAERLVPGGAFVYCAHFPDDGYHRSGRSVRARCRDALFENFTFPAERVEPTPYETLRRRAESGTRRADQLRNAGIGARIPVVHGALRIARAGGVTAAVLDRFYARSAAIDPSVETLLRLCDGRATVAEIEAATALRDVPVRAVVREFIRRGMMVVR